MILVSFFLGPAIDLASRTVKSYNLATVPPTLLETLTPGASAESCEFDLPDDARIRIELVDVTAAGDTLAPAIYDMQTGLPELALRIVSGGGLLRPVSFDEESSLSSSSTSTLSTSSTLSSSSSSSSESLSSSSSSSSQSVSTSSSSQTMSESSLSSLSTSSLSTTSTSSVSSSSLSSSSSSGP